MRALDQRWVNIVRRLPNVDPTLWWRSMPPPPPGESVPHPRVTAPFSTLVLGVGISPPSPFHPYRRTSPYLPALKH